MEKDISRIYDYLKNQFGIKDLDFDIVEGGRGRLYAYRQCDNVGKLSHRHFYALYLGRIYKDGIRLSIEGSFLIGRLASKGILDIDKDRAIRWMSGENIEGRLKGYVILRWKNYFLGCGKGDGGVIRNFIPKDRRITR